jgi:hypothetical protein
MGSSPQNLLISWSQGCDRSNMHGNRNENEKRISKKIKKATELDLFTKVV